jgi:hypothetical protein
LIILREETKLSSGVRDSSLGPKEDYYLLMLKVNPEKEVVAVKWSLSGLDEDSAALVIDEQSERLYVWIGQGVDGITKAIARRKAADISSQGFKLPSMSYPVGKVTGKKLDVIEVDQAELAKDNKLRDVFSELKSLFRKKTELLEGDVLARATVKVPVAMRQLGSFTRAPPQFQEVSKALEEKFGRAPEIFAERETMRERYAEREYDKVAAIYTLAFVEVLGGKVNVEIERQGRGKVYHVAKEIPTAQQTAVVEPLEAAEMAQPVQEEERKNCSFAIEEKRLKILESNLTQEEINRVIKRVEELTL